MNMRGHEHLLGLVAALVAMMAISATAMVTTCDPVESWLAYAVARGGGRAVTNVTVSYTVPPLPVKPGGIGSFWWGLEPAPACDLMQPVLALGRLGKGNASWSIFNERFDWLDSPRSFTTAPKFVAPGARVTSNIHTGGTRYRMSIGPVVDYEGHYSYSYLDLDPKQVYSDVYVVVEHQPDSCSEMPASGAMVFDHVAIELDGALVQPKWEVVQGSKPACDCKAEAVDAATVKFTWSTATPALKLDDGAALSSTKRWSDAPPAIPGMQIWKQRVRQGHHGYRADSLGDADFFLALLIGVPGPRPALLAFTEVRKFTDTDWDAKGIGMRASYDGGRTFTTSVEVVTDPPQAANLTREWTDGPFHGEGWDGLSLGTVTYDNHTGEVLVHYTLCANPCIQFGCVRPKSCGPDYTSRTMIVSSTDSFSTWSAPVEVSAQLASGKKPIKTFFPGSGEGTQTASGRLIICGYTIDCAPAQGQSRNCTDPQHCRDNCQSSVLILSDTHGKTWRAGARVTDHSAAPTNECDAVVLRNGSVLVSMRSYGTSRMQARSDDGGETFVASSIRHVPALPSPGCQSSLIADAEGTLFLSHPYSPSTRENMSVSVSRDDGAESAAGGCCRLDAPHCLSFVTIHTKCNQGRLHDGTAHG
jgi:hypothetical protein